MSKETPNRDHEMALAVLKTAVAEGTLADAHKAELAELIGQSARPKLAETLETHNERPVADTPAEKPQAPAESEKRELTPKQEDQLLGTLKIRFGKPENDKLREAIDFADVEKALRATPEKLYALHKLEKTGGEPQVIGLDGDEFVFEDRCKESPSRRRFLNFDQSLAQAKEFGADMQSPDAYQAMQKTGNYDLATSSWLETDPAYREEYRAAVRGFRDGVGVSVYGQDFHYRQLNRGWRAALRVKKA